MVKKKPVLRNKDLTDIPKFEQQIKVECLQIDNIDDKINYLKEKRELVHKEIDVQVRIDFNNGIVVSDEYLNLDILEKNIISEINLLKALPQDIQTITIEKGDSKVTLQGKPGPSFIESYNKINPNISDPIISAKSQKSKEITEPENLLIIWNKSEKLKEFLTELINEKFIKKGDLRNSYLHFFIEDNPGFNPKTKVAPEKKILWLGALRNLAYLIENLFKNGIISAKCSNVDLTVMHFSTRKVENLDEDSVRTTFDEILQYNEEYIYEKKSKTRIRYQKLYEIIRKFSIPKSSIPKSSIPKSSIPKSSIPKSSIP